MATKTTVPTVPLSKVAAELAEKTGMTKKDATGALPYIEVYEGERFIVRVTGLIGYEPDAKETSMMKFKIGQYRDYMPSTDAMDIDWVRVAPAY